MDAKVVHVADVVPRTRTDATWQARPHGKACEAHAACRWREWRGHVARIHTGPLGRSCGVPHGEGLAVGGPTG